MSELRPRRTEPVRQFPNHADLKEHAQHAERREEETRLRRSEIQQRLEHQRVDREPTVECQRICQFLYQDRRDVLVGEGPEDVGEGRRWSALALLRDLLG